MNQYIFFNEVIHEHQNQEKPNDRDNDHCLESGQQFESERGKPITEKVKNAARWCLDQDMVTKGHPLCWHTLTADWLLSMSSAEILQAQISLIKREVSDFRRLIDMWDVINEAVIMPVFDKYDNSITRLCKELGRIKTIKTMFEKAREMNLI